jgi:hypothetical protein
MYWKNLPESVFSRVLVMRDIDLDDTFDSGHGSAAEGGIIEDSRNSHSSLPKQRTR